jgi:rhamnosyltransferase
MARLAIYMFYNAHGNVDEYVEYKLQTLAEQCEEILVVVNGFLTDDGRSRLERVSTHVLIRENIGFDVWAYREALLSVGWEKLSTYDEIVLCNYTFFGPLFPWSEMFGEMLRRPVDFWGVSAHKAVENSFADGARLPYHIQSHFIVCRRSLVSSSAFREYWEAMPPIESYIDSVKLHESRFTNHFEQLGFAHSVYVSDNVTPALYPLFQQIADSIEWRCPILKRRPFFHDPAFLDINAIDLRKALLAVSEKSDYDTALIWENLSRDIEPRVLYTNTTGLHIITDGKKYTSNSNIAVVAHVSSVETLVKCRPYLESFPAGTPFYVTTDPLVKKEAVEFEIARVKGTVVGKIVELMPGEDDMSALLSTHAPSVASSGYDLVCKLVFAQTDPFIKNIDEYRTEYCLDSLVGQDGHLLSVLQLLDSRKEIGMLMPPTMHVSQYVLGHSWWGMKEQVVELAARLKLSIAIDNKTPLAPLEGMFWFRPDALQPMLCHTWDSKQFTRSNDGTHRTTSALVERLLTYCAHARGYVSHCVLDARQAEFSYAKLEYKLQELSSHFSTGNFLIAMEEAKLLEFARNALDGSNAEEKIASLEKLLNPRHR